MTMFAQMTIEVDPLADADAMELVELVLLLRAELLDANVEAVELAREDEAPPGAKAVNALVVGQLAVVLSQSLPVLRSVIAAIHDWVSHHRVGGVKIQLDGDVLEITHASAEEQHRLIEAWIARHAVPPVNAPR